MTRLYREVETAEDHRRLKQIFAPDVRTYFVWACLTVLGGLILWGVA